MNAYKSVTQQTAPNSDLRKMMRVFTKMVNRCIWIVDMSKSGETRTR
ncbi:MAG: hypothetical protein OXP12_05525 [Thaumarchaeota archaeon]|nr:hypothetical protein [Nitrososphaerota archaeon]MDE0266312.1 hypothetical protein [Nitrososphaerota archaeon]MDE0525923.1 hypothetical protein [Nitrososphaerota archaeon]